MRTTLRLSLLVFAMSVAPFLAAQEKAAAAGPVTVKVSESHLVNECSTDAKGSSCSNKLQIKATINGRTYWLESQGERKFLVTLKAYLLEPGEYTAILADEEHKGSYKFNSVYELTYPDGKTEKFDVIGVAQ
jgi:uncharacterized protein YcfL